jgi:hypothetical protein
LFFDKLNFLSIFLLPEIPQENGIINRVLELKTSGTANKGDLLPKKQTTKNRRFRNKDFIPFSDLNMGYLSPSVKRFFTLSCQKHKFGKE